MSGLYNRYIAGAWPDGTPVPQPPASVPETPLPQTPSVPAFADVTAEPVPETAQERPKGLSALKGLFGGNIKLPEFDADTVLLLVLVYFLVADDSENISDTLLIISVLLLLGF